jgi:putative ABC transport system ATP-binding protein
LAEPVLEIAGLAKRYGASTVFEGVDLALAAGEFVAIVGESGVGKSTLLNCAAGLDRVDAGSVRVTGTDIQALDESAQALFRRQSVGANVALPLLLQQAANPQRVRAMLAAVGLGGFETRLPHTLSGGQLQRVAIARALVHRPALILADEPTGNLDPATAERVLSLLVEQVREHGAACLLVTHSRAAAARADRSITLTPTGIVA